MGRPRPANLHRAKHPTRPAGYRHAGALQRRAFLFPLGTRRPHPQRRTVRCPAFCSAATGYLVCDLYDRRLRQSLLRQRIGAGGPGFAGLHHRARAARLLRRRAHASGTDQAAARVRSLTNGSTALNGGASWSVIAGVTGSVYATPPLTAPRMYRVAVGSSACGSVTTTPVTVQVLPDPSLSITASSPTVCLGGWTTLNAVPNNGAGTCTTQWQSSSSASGPWTNIAGATGNSHAASTLVPGIRYYRATYSCSGGGCDMAFSNVVSITVMPAPSIGTQPAGATICSGGTHTLNVAATGGTPALSYQWQSSPDGMAWSALYGYTQSSLTTPPLTAHTYYRVAVSASGSGCGTVYSQAALVQVVALPAWSLAPAQAVLCPDTSLMLSVPDAQGVSFLWPDGSTAPQWEVQQPGAYSVVLTHNTYGCSDTLSVNVSAAPAWTQSIEASSDFLCDEVQEIKLTLNGTSGGSYSYAWSGGSLTEQQILTASGVYYLTLTDDATGCSTVLSRVIQNSDTDITLRIEAPDTLLCRDSEMTLRAVLDGLHESLRERVSYYWRHDGSTNETVSIYGPRLYEITTDFGGGCIQNAEWEILQAPDLEVRIQSPEGTKHACPESPLLLRAVVSDSTLVAAYHWTGGADTPEAVFTESGPYTLRVTDVNGCVWEDRFEVKPCPTIVFFDTLRVQVKAEETAELCLRLINPSQETATTVEVAIEGSPAPYFGEAEALRSVEFAPGETRQCLSYLPPRVEEADSITLYTLRLQNAAGGNAAAIGEARQAELLIEAGIRCRVQQDSAAVNCAVTDTTSIQNGVPLISTLKKDDSFWAGDFEVKVTQANGNGTFNGKGIITVPYLKQAQINVILKDVRVNEECQMVAGEVKVEGVGAAILSEELANALNDLLGTLDDIDGVLGAVEDVFNTISTVINASSEVNSVLSTNWNVLHGADPIYNEYPDLPDSLRQQINEALLCYLSQPPSVCNAQLSQTIAGLIAAINALFEADYAIQFRRYPQQHYGFDSLMYQPMVDDYNFLTVANQPYRVAWKSVEAGRTDSVLLLTPFAQLPDSLHFETNSRTPVPHHEHACGAGCADNGAAILPVTGGEHNTVYQIYPVQTRRDSLGNPERKYAGKLNVVSYNNKVTQVVIVPINGAGNLTDSDRAAIESQLNEIYRPAVAAFTVELLLPSLSLDWFATEAQNTLDSTNSAFYADYNAQMQRINQEINRLPGYDPEKYYLIVVQNAQGGIKGFMPRARNKGFIVATGHGSLSDLGRTMAHELGHGAFRLRHPWEQFSGLVPGQTDNLMDYASGTRLHHYQWHIVHNPPPLAGLLDGDEEGELVGIKYPVANFGFLIWPYERNNLEGDKQNTIYFCGDVSDEIKPLIMEQIKKKLTDNAIKFVSTPISPESVIVDFNCRFNLTDFPEAGYYRISEYFLYKNSATAQTEFVITKDPMSYLDYPINTKLNNEDCNCFEGSKIELNAITPRFSDGENYLEMNIGTSPSQYAPRGSGNKTIRLTLTRGESLPYSVNDFYLKIKVKNDNDIIEHYPKYKHLDNDHIGSIESGEFEIPLGGKFTAKLYRKGAQDEDEGILIESDLSWALGVNAPMQQMPYLEFTVPENNTIDHQYIRVQHPSFAGEFTCRIDYEIKNIRQPLDLVPNLNFDHSAFLPSANDNQHQSNQKRQQRELRQQLFTEALVQFRQHYSNTVLNSMYNRTITVYSVPANSSLLGEPVPGGERNGLADQRLGTRTGVSFSLYNKQFENGANESPNAVIMDASVYRTPIEVGAYNDFNTLLSSSKKKRITRRADSLLIRISVTNSLKAQQIRTMITSGILEHAFIEDIKIAVYDYESNLLNECYVESQDVKIFIRENEIEQSWWTTLFGHEMGHVAFPQMRKYEKLKWTLIRDASLSQTKYKLADGLGGNGPYGCSTGNAHERHNPENRFVCDIDRFLRALYPD
jgi:hypothetical protein